MSRAGEGRRRERETEREARLLVRRVGKGKKKEKDGELRGGRAVRAKQSNRKRGRQLGSKKKKKIQDKAGREMKTMRAGGLGGSAPIAAFIS